MKTPWFKRNRTYRKNLKMKYKRKGMKIYIPKPTDTVMCIPGISQNAYKMHKKGYIFTGFIK